MYRYPNASAQRRAVGDEKTRMKLNKRLRKAFEDLCELTGGDRWCFEVYSCPKFGVGLTLTLLREVHTPDIPAILY